MPTAEEKAKVFDLLCQGKKEFEAEQYDIAKALYNQALALIEERGMKTKWRFELREFVATCEHRLGNFTRAIEMNEETLHLLIGSESSSAKKGIARIRYNLARDLEATRPAVDRKEDRRERLLKAENLLKENLKLQESECENALLRETRLSLGKVYQELQMFVEAERVYERLVADSLSSSSLDLRWNVAVTHGYATALYSLGRYATARDGFLQLKRMLRQHFLDNPESGTEITRWIQAQISNVNKFLVNCADAIEPLGRGNQGLLKDAHQPSENLVPPRGSITPDHGKTKGTKSACHMSAVPEDHRKRKSETSSESELRPKKRQRVQALSEPNGIIRRSLRVHRSTASLANVSRSKSKAFDAFKSHDKDRVRSSPPTPSNEDLPKSMNHSSLNESVSAAYAKTGKEDIWFSKLQEYTHGMLYPNSNPMGRNPGRRRVRVAIIDSGIDLARMKRQDYQQGQGFGNWPNYLQGKISKYMDFADNEDWVESGKVLHGTRCASLLIQTAPQADLYIANVRRKGKDSIQPKAVANALAWAMEEEVDIISMSFGWEGEQKEVSEQLNLARDKILLFAAVSNDGENGPPEGVFPAWHPSVFCVHSCDPYGRQSKFTPRAYSDRISLMLPGENVAVLNKQSRVIGGFGRAEGASYATPIAAGTAALVLDLIRQRVTVEGKAWDIERQIKNFAGMSLIFKRMSKNNDGDGYSYVRPWQMLGLHKPTRYVDDPERSHLAFALDRVLEALEERFEKVEGPI